MKKILHFLSRPWLLTLILIILLALIIWLIGPLIAVAEFKPLASEIVRLVCIFILFIIWGLNNLRHTKKKDKKTNTLTKDITDNNKEVIVKSKNADEKIIAERFNKAIKTLQTASFSKRNKLYHLPWYVIIGLPGSGKTTALKQSGLQFPLHSQFGDEPIQGSGGTRFCDWWFTNEAIMIDTAGRYTAQEDAKKSDAQSWRGFLNILKKGRPKRPLNGIIVTINVQDLLSKTNTQKSLHAASIKQRIQELNHQLNMELPVYVVITKTDTIAGFSSFFSDMEKEDREQAWGFNLPQHKNEKETDFNTHFEREYTSLMGTLSNRVLYLLDHEKSQTRRNLIHQFPNQMHALKPMLFEFLNNIFTPNQFETPLIIRGVYFISSTQANMGAQWISGSLPVEKLNDPIDQINREPKTFFVNQLFKNVIFKEANLANIDSRSKRRFRLAYYSMLTLTIVTFSSLVYFWHNSMGMNRDYMQTLRADVNQYMQVTDGGLIDLRDWLSLTEGLNHLRDLPTGFIEGSEGYPLQQGFGFYQGHKLGTEASTTYKKALHAFLMTDINHLLERQIKQATDDEQLYESLKFYLMQYHPDKMEKDLFILWVDILLQRDLPGENNTQLREQLLEHLNIALDNTISPAPIDQTLVDTARETLVLTPLDVRLYRRLKNDYQKSNPGNFNLESLLGKKGDYIFYRESGSALSEGIPYLFTYSGFHSVYNIQNKQLAERLANEQWIYGDTLPEDLSEEKIKSITSKVDEYYFAEYISLWSQFIQDIRIRSFNSINQGQAVLRLLASSEQPLVKVIQAIRKNTALNEAPMVSKEKQEAVGELAETFADDEKNRLERLVPLTALGGDLSLPGYPVADAFESFNRYAQVGDGLPLAQLQTAINQLNIHFSELANAGNFKEAAFSASLDAKSGADPIVGLRRALSETQIDVRKWFGKVSQNASLVTTVAAKGHVNDTWKTDVVSFYDKAIKDRYPINPNSAQEIKLSDFATFFGPTGILQTYFDENLKPFVDQSQQKWRWKNQIGISNNRLAVFQQADAIQKSYFASGSSSPQASFRLKPISLDKITSGVLIETGGQSIGYNHGPLNTEQLEWPGDATKNSTISFSLMSRGTPVSSRTEGEWAWFRLLDKYASIETDQRSDKLALSFALKGITMEYELTPESSFNPFINNAIRGFEIPEKL